MVRRKPVKKIALFHPWIKSKGGAEKVVLELMEKSKHKINLYTWIYDRENTFDEFKNFNIKVVAPKFGAKLSRLHLLRGLFFPISLFSKIPLQNYDLFLISTSGVGEFITFRNKLKGKTLAYVHTPLRYANKNLSKWEKRNKTFIKKMIYSLAIKIYRFLEKHSWKNLDMVIFNSELSRERAKESNILKKKENFIVYPPFDASRFENLKKGKNENMFLYWSRLNPPKRQDLLIRAWKGFVKKNPKYKLCIVGDIDNKDYFEKLKKLQSETKNIEIKTNVPNKELDNIFANSIAGLFLGYEEDFGIIPFEILASGKPLIAVNKGGYVKLIKDHPNFYKIDEKQDSKKMVKEIEKSLDNFVKTKQTSKTKYKIKTGNFIEEIEEIIDKIK
jgi:glycosyltransferase involved in cell wall biosynthesis